MYVTVLVRSSLAVRRHYCLGLALGTHVTVSAVTGGPERRRAIDRRAISFFFFPAS